MPTWLMLTMARDQILSKRWLQFWAPAYLSPCLTALTPPSLLDVSCVLTPRVSPLRRSLKCSLVSSESAQSHCRPGPAGFQGGA